MTFPVATAYRFCIMNLLAVDDLLSCQLPDSVRNRLKQLESELQELRNVIRYETDRYVTIEQRLHLRACDQEIKKLTQQYRKSRQR